MEEKQHNRVVTQLKLEKACYPNLGSGCFVTTQEGIKVFDIIKEYCGQQ